MLVRNWMSRNVVTVEADDSMAKAGRLMKENKVSRLPVMKKGKLVGIVTNGDIRRASASDATSLEIHELLYLLSKIKIGSIMTPDPITVPPDYTVEEVAQILRERGISGVPVVETDGRLVGIITKNDLFNVIVSLTGFDKKGIQFAVRIEDRPGSIKEVTDIIRSYGGRLASILSSYEKVPEGYRNVFIRTYDVDRAKVDSLVNDLRAKITLRYYVDHRENKRMIYDA
ncbi:MAG: CBS domain-containing protein [Deltaproteobacteria bacterium]|nr:CBS domain-containing protein [Deltaproteobacteria bacterium]